MPKTEVRHLRFEPSLIEALDTIARAQRRTTASLIHNTLSDHVEAVGHLYDIPKGAV